MIPNLIKPSLSEGNYILIIIIIVQLYTLNISLYFYKIMFIIPEIILPMSVRNVFDFSKYKRQIEILGLCLPDIKNRDTISIYDLCDLYRVSIPTIERDLGDLRQRGIPIHSQAKEGITINGILNHDLIKNELLRYISICYADNFDELLNFYTFSRDKWNMLSLFVKLQKSIDDIREIKIALKGNPQHITYIPRKIIRKSRKWYIIVEYHSSFEAVLISDINEIEDSGCGEVCRYKNGIDEFIESHFKAEIMSKYELILSFASKLNGEFPSQITKTEFLKYDSNGNKVISAVCNNLDEIVPWLISNTGDVIVLDPPELKDKLIKIAQSILHEYDENKKRIYFSRSDSLVPKYEYRDILYYKPIDSNFKISFTLMRV